MSSTRDSITSTESTNLGLLNWLLSALHIKRSKPKVRRNLHDFLGTGLLGDGGLDIPDKLFEKIVGPGAATDPRRSESDYNKSEGTTQSSVDISSLSDMSRKTTFYMPVVKKNFTMDWTGRYRSPGPDCTSFQRYTEIIRAKDEIEEEEMHKLKARSLIPAPAEGYFQDWLPQQHDGEPLKRRMRRFSAIYRAAAKRKSRQHKTKGDSKDHEEVEEYSDSDIPRRTSILDDEPIEKLIEDVTHPAIFRGIGMSQNHHTDKLIHLKKVAEDKEHFAFLRDFDVALSEDVPIPAMTQVCKECIPVLESVVSYYKRNFGSDHRVTLEAMTRLEVIQEELDDLKSC